MPHLRHKRVEDEPDFPLAMPAFQRHEEIRRAEIAIVLRNFELQNQMVAKRVPGQLRDEGVILMQVLAKMREDDVGRDLALEPFKGVFDVQADIRKAAVPKIVDRDVFLADARQEQFGAPQRLLLPLRRRAEDHPMHGGIGPFFQ